MGTYSVETHYVTHKDHSTQDHEGLGDASQRSVTIARPILKVLDLLGYTATRFATTRVLETKKLICVTRKGCSKTFVSSESSRVINQTNVDGFCPSSQKYTSHICGGAINLLASLCPSLYIFNLPPALDLSSTQLVRFSKGIFHTCYPNGITNLIVIAMLDSVL